ncbi:MAG: protein kinase [Polyangiales bacterium]
MASGNVAPVAAQPPPTHHSNLPSPALMAPGTRLGRYEIIGELGTGGMATVYEGRALSVGGFARRVAIKYLHPHLLRDEQFVQMFMDEGRLAAGIHHPNVVAVVDLVLEAQCMYMVSEYVEGDQLLALFKSARDAKTRIPAPIAIRIALDMLAGLHAAHELAGDDGTPLRIVHRDVSPHNVLVGADGITRITDFGIAKAEERISTTRDGIVKGKLSYMAPEQPDDMPVDRRADLFSAATVLWECLTSRRLFPGRSDREVLEALLRKPIPTLREVVPELPVELDEVLMKALARNPDERFDTAAEFAEALEVGARGVGVATPREVARYVEVKSASKLGAERQRRRAMTTKELPVYRPSATPDAPAAASSTATTSPVPSTTSVRTEPGLGPPRDPDDQPTMLSAPHAIKSIRGSGAPLPVDEFEDPTIVKPGATPKPLPAVLPSSATPGSATPPAAAAAHVAPVAALAPPVVFKPPSLPTGPVPAPPRPSQSPRVALLALFVIAFGSALGYGIWLVVRPTAPIDTAASVTPSTSTATAALETTRAINAPPPMAPLTDIAPPHVAPPPIAPPPEAPPHVAPPPMVPATATRPSPAVVAARPVAPRPITRPRVATEPTPTAPREASPAPTASPVAPTPPAAPAAPSGPRLPRHI